MLLCSANAFARRVYVRLASDAAAWSHVTTDFDNVLVTLPEGSTDFAKDALIYLRPGDEVWVAKGVYENSATVTLLNDENAGLQYGNIQLYGGFAGTETDVNQRAVTDKDGNGLTEPWELVNETNFKGRGTSTPSDFRLVNVGSGSVLDGVTLVPVAPHTLSNRPIVLPGESSIDIEITESRDAVAYFDMQEFCDVLPGDVLRIRQAKESFTLLHPIGYDYFEVLRRKLKWNYMPTGK